MVSIWVTDPFERKDVERDLLAKLLVNLVKSQDGTLSQAQLIRGFESVLLTLEDAVNDAPKAAEFLGRIFAEVKTENVVSLNEIGRLIHDGGEEPGSLLEVGLAADVLGSTLEVIQHEKGEVVLCEIRSNSNLRLETFRPPNPITSRKLEKFIYSMFSAMFIAPSTEMVIKLTRGGNVSLDSELHAGKWVIRKQLNYDDEAGFRKRLVELLRSELSGGEKRDGLPLEGLQR